ncbi:hypothetical protein [Nostoc sp.]|uniref:hypothetical protein n=1 Tax=Nostoc sp. TaxID=1180 RepID=UPI002FFAB083
MNNDQNFNKRNEIKLGYAIATAMDAIAPRFLNPAGSCYSMTFYQNNGSKAPPF